jgi:hypothetical protein
MRVEIKVRYFTKRTAADKKRASFVRVLGVLVSASPKLFALVALRARVFLSMCYLMPPCWRTRTSECVSLSEPSSLDAHAKPPSTNIHRATDWGAAWCSFLGPSAWVHVSSHFFSHPMLSPHPLWRQARNNKSTTRK